MSHPGPWIVNGARNTGHPKLLLWVCVCACVRLSVFVFVCDFKPSVVTAKLNTSEIKWFIFSETLLRSRTRALDFSSETACVVQRVELWLNYIDNTQDQLPEMRKKSAASMGHWVHQGLPVCRSPCWMRQCYSDWRRTICYAVRHCRLACHIYNANTSLGTHAKCMVIGIPRKDYRTHCFVEVLLRPLKGKHL